jgi:DNA-binding PadR family transcriptional regulator
MNKELVGATTSLLVLKVLAERASYGYDIVKRLNREAEGLFLWQEGTLYPVLHKLEKSKLVRTQWQDADTGRRRKYYYITAEGREALEERSQEWSAINAMVLRMGESTNG